MNKTELKQEVQELLIRYKYNSNLYTVEQIAEIIHSYIDQLEVDLYKIPYSTLEAHLKERGEEAEEYLKWM